MATVRMNHERKRGELGIVTEEELNEYQEALWRERDNNDPDCDFAALEASREINAHLWRGRVADALKAAYGSR